MPEETTYCGFVAIVGRPNVGKSTLMNRILGEKISITSRKPQTTRHKIVGVHTDKNLQVVFVDTPGIHGGQTKALNRYMNKAARSALRDVDVIVFMISAPRWEEEDQAVLSLLKGAKCPVLLAINKVDQVKEKDALLPYIESVSGKGDFAHVVPLSAKLGSNLDAFMKLITSHMPESHFYYDPDQITDRSNQFLISEIIREKLVRFLGEELPYATTVEIEQLKEEDKMFRIHGLIWVEREGQKKIIIGKSGEKLKKIGTEARKDMERLLDKKVFLKLWVKVKSSWSDSERVLKQLGYD